MSQPIPPSPDQIRDAVECIQSMPLSGPNWRYCAAILLIIDASKAFAEHMEKQPADLGEFDIARLGRNGSARREAVIEIDTFGGPRPTHENVPDRLDSIVKRLIEIEGALGPLAPYRVRSVDQDLAAIHARLAKSDEEAALNLTATDARMVRLSGIINELDQRVTEIEVARAWIDAFEIKQRIEGFSASLKEVQMSLAKLENPQHTNRIPLPSTVAKMPDWYPYRLRGGWFNVWLRSHDREVSDPQFVGPYDTEAEAARHRDLTGQMLYYACIYRKAIERGAGL